MIRVAWLTCTLLAIAYARIYERCELARDLQALGVEPRHLATWVCIAFHESRFDTAARNGYSGDHGIFQISELYWCGPGKACGLPCSAFRDADISNDLKCALQIYEEHTRLQGDGFRAWVVYPTSCAHNTKKYLVDCDISAQYYVPITRSRNFIYEENYLSNDSYTSKTHVSKPSYLAIGAIFKQYYGRMLSDTKENVNWLNYKIKNVDDLKIPSSLMQATQSFTEPTPITTKQTTTEYFPPVIPWRSIETNQFRKKQHTYNKSFEKSSIQKTYSSIMRNNIENIENSRTSISAQSDAIKKTTPQPHFNKDDAYSTDVSSKRLSTISSTMALISTTTLRPTTSVAPSKTSTITTNPWRQPTFTVASYSFATTKPTTQNSKSTNITSESIYNNTMKQAKTEPLALNLSTERSPRTRSTTSKPTTNKKTIERSISTTQTTEKPYIKVSTTVKAISSHNIPSNYEVATKPTTTRKPSTDFSWNLLKSRTTTSSVVTENPSALKVTTPVTNSTVAWTQRTTQKPKTTQSIFDIYLNPTKPPKLPPLQFHSLPTSKLRLKIFDSGTTTPAPTNQTNSQRNKGYNGGGVKDQNGR